MNRDNLQWFKMGNNICICKMLLYKIPMKTFPKIPKAFLELSTHLQPLLTRCMRQLILVTFTDLQNPGEQQRSSWAALWQQHHPGQLFSWTPWGAALMDTPLILTSSTQLRPCTVLVLQDRSQSCSPTRPSPYRHIYSFTTTCCSKTNVRRERQLTSQQQYYMQCDINSVISTVQHRQECSQVYCLSVVHARGGWVFISHTHRSERRPLGFAQNENGVKINK